MGFNELDQVVLVTLYASGGCLNDHITRIRYIKMNDFINSYLRPFVRGLKFLMSMDIVHRSLGGRNVLIRYDSPNDITNFVLQVIKILIRAFKLLNAYFNFKDFRFWNGVICSSY